MWKRGDTAARYVFGDIGAYANDRRLAGFNGEVARLLGFTRLLLKFLDLITENKSWTEQLI